VEWDGEGAFFRMRVEGEAAQRGPDDAPACVTRRGEHGGRSAYLAWARLTGEAMLGKVDAVVGGVWAGVEG